MSNPENSNPTDDIDNLVGKESDIELPEIGDDLVGTESEAALESLLEESPTLESQDPIDSSLRGELEKWKDIAARSQADLENYRKRMAREKSEAIQYANSSLLHSLLPVIDNFEMGLKAAENEDPNSLIFQGMAMVQKQMLDFLTENRVELIETPAGTAFDPNRHEAIKQEPSDSVPEGQIIYAVRRGYVLKDRLLRPANVVVSQGNSTPAAEESSTSDTEST